MKTSIFRYLCFVLTKVYHFIHKTEIYIVTAATSTVLWFVGLFVAGSHHRTDVVKTRKKIIWNRSKFWYLRDIDRLGSVSRRYA
jgi:hypothetical protein